MKRLFIIVSIAVFCLNLSFGQEIQVKNSRGDEPLENVAIFNQHMNKSTITNLNGVASISKFDETDTLFFQHPSYELSIIAYTQLPGTGIIHLERKNIIIPEFVITASKHRENKREVPYLVDILTPKKLELTTSQNSADILSSTGNIFVQKSQSGGGSPVLRGFEANKVLLVIDGVRMNNAIYRGGHLQNSLTIDNAVLERVEIIYGPTSVIYGSDALGGVIHYMSKKPKLADIPKTFQLNGTAYVQTATANSSLKGHLDLNFGFEKVALLSSITYSKFNDMRMGNRRNPFFEDWGKQFDYVERIKGTDSVVTNSNSNYIRQAGYEQIDFMQKVRYQPTNFIDIQANFQFSTSTNINRQDQLNNRNDDGLPEFAEWYYGPQTRGLALLKASFSNSNDFYDNLEATIAYQNIEESRYTREFKIDTIYEQVEGVHVGSLNLDFYKKVSNKHDFSYGLDLNYNDVSSDALKRNIVTNYNQIDITRYPDEGTKTMASGGYASYKTRLHTKLITAVGIRFQHYSLKAKYGEFYSDLPEVFRDVNLENQAITSSLSFIVNQTRNFKWNLIFSTGFRSPNLDDLAKIRLTSGKLTLPNTDLKPEYSYNAEIGISKTFDGYIQINANYFFTYLTEAITRIPFTFEDGSDSIYFQGSYRTTYQNVNSSEALLHGFTVNLISDLNSNIKFKSTLNYTYGKNLTDNTPLAHIPPIFGRTDFSYELKKFIFDIYFVYAGWKHLDDMVTTGEDKEDEATQYGFPGWYTINVNSVYSINKHLDIQFAIENLTDNFYKPFASGVPAPGINFMGTLRTKF